MSNFICEHCEKEIIDSSEGYITGCSHYPEDYPEDKLHEENRRKYKQKKIIENGWMKLYRKLSKQKMNDR